ncbi:MAG: DsbA family protein, partial [Halioglobus sp.]|nr:DsbA family protein [Halioglobus sp.]
MTESSPATTDAFDLRVDIVSDVVCPWCIIGYKQLESALAAMPGQFNVTITWHPFELNPQMPPEGQDLREHLRQKYGRSAAEGGAARDRLTALG